MHLRGFFSRKQESNVCNQVARIEVRNRRGPSRTNAFGAIHQDERHDRVVEVRLDALTILIEIVQQRIVTFREHRSAHWVQASEDVTRARMILTALQARPKLTTRHEQVNVVRTDKVLRQVDDSHRQRGFTVVIGRVFGDVTAQLRNLDVRFKLTLEA